MNRIMIIITIIILMFAGLTIKVGKFTLYIRGILDVLYERKYGDKNKKMIEIKK